MLNRQITASQCVGQRLCLLLGALVLCSLIAVKPLRSQTDPVVTRKVVTRVEPDYPETLKRMYIGGVVRVEVVVNPSGTVESAQVLGGNPILGQAAMKAVKRWKYVPAAAKEKFVVKFEFDPHGN